MSLTTLFHPPALSRLSEALRLMPDHRIRAGEPVHPSLRHLAGDPELHR
jgi:hypothetical protein